MNPCLDWRGMRVALIAPHPDDIAYSIGGFAAGLADGAELVLVTVFTRSAWALPKALRLAGPEAVAAAREAEDLAFCRRLGMRFHSLGFADSSLSGYDDDSERVADPAQDARAPLVAERLNGLLAGLAPDVVLAPAGIGGHVDHRIVHDALRYRCAGAWRLAFYEDLPYAAEYTLPQLESALDLAGLTHLAAIDISPVWHEKLAALRDYPSQTEQDTVDAILAHARRMGEWSDSPSSYVERILEAL
ncbi:PIG-L deacetylase family protein [Paludibacterium paludis]|uniref:LmbE family N-acetylglucosaminyl deacetylase n=1 Tax=Paludibacterium paludis TaxID=1225769 RepID=A0A918P5R5_9NEIS|nr:PIG-L family deacetylase [Paludibacterium paludis]GGY24629.1 hypothetical protein GCM10011289_30310 [Paludibacterium paludis]